MAIFIRIVFVVVKLKIAKVFLYQFVSTKLPFEFLNPYFPKYCVIWVKFSPEVVFKQIKNILELKIL